MVDCCPADGYYSAYKPAQWCVPGSEVFIDCTDRYASCDELAGFCTD